MITLMCDVGPMAGLGLSFLVGKSREGSH